MSADMDLSQRTADPSQTSDPRERLVRVYVWDPVVRLTHWLLALSLHLLAITGYYLGEPFASVPGEARWAFTTGNVRAVHMATAFVFSLSLLVRIYWLFAGPAPARWPNFVPVARRRRQDVRRTALFYLFLRDRYPPALSHNPLAGVTYLLVYGLMLVMVVTGLGLYAASAHVDSPWRAFDLLAGFLGGLQTLHWIHHVVMWLLLGFFVHHLASALLSSQVERNGTVESMFSGYKWVPADEVEDRADR